MLIFTNTRETDAPVIFLIEKKGKGYWQEFNQTLERDKLNWAWYKHSTLKDRYKTSSRHTGNETSSQKFSTWYTGGHGPQNGLFSVKAFFMFFFGQTLGSHMASLHKGIIQILTREITLYLSSTQPNSSPTPYPYKSLSIYQHHLIDSNFDLLQIYINCIAWWHTWCNQTLIRDLLLKSKTHQSNQ